MAYDDGNIFAKILNMEIPAKIVYQDEMILAFHDAFPVAPVHVLVIPKGKYTDFDDFISNAGESDILYYFKKVKEIAKDLNLDDYRIMTNKGSGSGQTVFHFHTHIISGNNLKKN